MRISDNHVYQKLLTGKRVDFSLISDQKIPDMLVTLLTLITVKSISNIKIILKGFLYANVTIWNPFQKSPVKPLNQTLQEIYNIIYGWKSEFDIWICAWANKTQIFIFLFPKEESFICFYFNAISIKSLFQHKMISNKNFRVYPNLMIEIEAKSTQFMLWLIFFPWNVF